MRKKLYATTVTRGESTKVSTQSNKVLIDWLRFTFPKPSMSIDELIKHLSDCMNLNLRGVKREKGLYGFKESISLEALIGNTYHLIGYIAYGGIRQKDRWMIDIQGYGCGHIKNWYAMHHFLEMLDARITRVDLACDFFDGKKSIADAVKLFKQDAFSMNGRRPKSNTRGDWLEKNDGRTLEIGNFKNGKMMCIYEKGKQLDDLQSPWTRWELRLGSRDRIIPFDVLLTPETYYAGAYPALQEILSHVKGTRIDTTHKTVKTNLLNMMRNLKQSYGKCFYVLKTIPNFKLDEFIDAITVEGLPKRLPLNYLDTSLHWNQLKAALKTL